MLIFAFGKHIKSSQSLYFYAVGIDILWHETFISCHCQIFKSSILARAAFAAKPYAAMHRKRRKPKDSEASL